MAQAALQGIDCLFSKQNSNRILFNSISLIPWLGDIMPLQVLQWCGFTILQYLFKGVSMDFCPVPWRSLADEELQLPLVARTWERDVMAALHKQ